MTSALLFVAVLVAVEISYRRWVRGSLRRWRKPAGEGREIDLTEVAEAPAEATAAVLRMPPRAATDRDARRSG